MVISGLIVAALGAVGLCGSVVMEVLMGEPIYMLLMKLSAGIFGVGGIMLGVTALRKR